ncbi:MAG TPA: HD domain-containing protein [Pirellulales bacterium]|jgi:guanosine-3',5'-bis(diphosphate) 3'-pyrophosphohydrolase|nr:HD domain-containing protein [Pirellulales bacterium]
MMNNGAPKTDLDRLLAAISFAARAHDGHFRKDGKTPYIAHPLRVMTIASRLFGVSDVDALMAAVLHDTIEDTRTDHDDLSELCGPRVADYVAALSKDKRLAESQREREYHDAMAAAPVAVQLCKLADVYDNLLDSVGMAAKDRRKKIDKAQEAVDRFAPTLTPEWEHALELVREAIRKAASE